VMDQVLVRLEQIVARLEAVEAKIGAGGAPAPSGGAAPAAGAGGAESAAARAWDDFLASYWAPFVATSDAIGGDNVKKQVAALSDANGIIRKIINAASQATQPSVEKLKEIVAPLAAIVKTVKDLRESNRRDKQWEHLSTLSEAVVYVNWVVVAPTPAPFVKESLDSSLFWSNKILTMFKGKDQKHIDWCNQLKDFFNEMQKYIKQYHTTGLAWNPKGVDYSQVASGAAPAAAAAKPCGPPPPGPPPPAASLMQAAPAAKTAAPDTNALFAALNKGDGVTTGLKKVTKDMQTHKNPALRAGGVVKTVEKPVAEPKNQPAQKKQLPPKGPVLEGNKWVIENHVGNNSIVIPASEMEPKNTIYIYKCERSTIQIPAKANSIVIDGGKRLGVVFSDIISGVEIVNSQNVNVQSQGRIPNFAVDKSSSVQIILSKSSLDAQVVTSKCDSVNIMFPNGDDHMELPVPEQFITTIVNNKLKTVTLEHE
jgi:adenylyl cyclase-associated protein